MSIISSRQHPLVGQCRAIASGDDPRVLLDGWHLLEDALAARVPLDQVAVDRVRAGGHEPLLAAAERAGARVVAVTAAVLDAMSPVRTATGVVAIASRPTVAPDALLAPAPALVLAGFGVQDPGNVGALIRSADAAGATGVLLDGHAADPWGWKALRAAMGSTFRIPVCREQAAATHIRAWQDAGLRVLAADPHRGATPIDTDLTGPLAFVLGAEGAGVPAAVLESATARVRIPMRPRVESLNVGVAAALLAYEAARQRGTLPS